MFRKLVTVIIISLFIFSSHSPVWARETFSTPEINQFHINSTTKNDMSFTIQKRVDSLNYGDDEHGKWATT